MSTNEVRLCWIALCAANLPDLIKEREGSRQDPSNYSSFNQLQFSNYSQSAYNHVRHYTRATSIKYQIKYVSLTLRYSSYWPTLVFSPPRPRIQRQCWQLGQGEQQMGSTCRKAGSGRKPSECAQQNVREYRRGYHCAPWSPLVEYDIRLSDLNRIWNRIVKYFIIWGLVWWQCNCTTEANHIPWAACATRLTRSKTKLDSVPPTGIGSHDGKLYELIGYMLSKHIHVDNEAHQSLKTSFYSAEPHKPACAYSLS